MSFFSRQGRTFPFLMIMHRTPLSTFWTTRARWGKHLTWIKDRVLWGNSNGFHGKLALRFGLQAARLQASTGERKRKGRDNKKNGKGRLCSRSIIRGRVVSANVSFEMFNAFSLCCPLSYFVLLNPGLHEDPGESNNLQSFPRQKKIHALF